MSTDRPEDAPERGGSGPLVIMLVAFAMLCTGSIGFGVYIVWRTARLAAERAQEARTEVDAAAAPKAQQEAGPTRTHFERVAKAVAEGLAAPDRLADSYTADGKPLLSWRVYLLPRLGESDVYRRFKLDEPWDGPTNKRLLERIPAAYDLPGPRDGLVVGGASIRGFSQEGAIFEPLARFTIRDIPAGADNTLAIFDSGEPVPWTKPDGLVWRAGDPRPNFGGTNPAADWFLAATASGRVVHVRKSVSDEVLRKLFDRRHDPRELRLPAGAVE
ncbi:MAG: hypothetical protein J2P46_01560 [Zavarzinella sp.]|nr:hypothetical protein [Zavarzinella sp.]